MYNQGEASSRQDLPTMHNGVETIAYTQDG
jgi:hypothetical protein